MDEEKNLPFDEFKRFESEYSTSIMCVPKEEDDITDLKDLIGDGMKIWETFRKSEFYHKVETKLDFSSLSLRFLLLPFYFGKLHFLFFGDERRNSLIQSYKYFQAFVEEMYYFEFVETKKRKHIQNTEETESDAPIELKKLKDLNDGKRHQLTPFSSSDDIEKIIVIDLLKVSVVEAKSNIRKIGQELNIYSIPEYKDLQDASKLRIEVFAPL